MKESTRSTSVNFQYAAAKLRNSQLHWDILITAESQLQKSLLVSVENAAVVISVWQTQHTIRFLADKSADVRRTSAATFDIFLLSLFSVTVLFVFVTVWLSFTSSFSWMLFIYCFTIRSSEHVPVSAIVHSPPPDHGYGTICQYTSVGLI